MGQTIGEAVDPNYRKEFDAVASAGRLGSAVLASFNPMGSESSILQLLSPTVVDPFVQWAENQNFAGIPLRPEQMPFDVPKPEYQMYWKNARDPSKWIAKKLNDITGGDAVDPGLVNISPEVFDLFLDTFTGGAGKFLDNTLTLPKTMSKEDVDVRRIPFVRRMYGEKNDFYLRTKFYDNLGEIRYAEKSIKHYREIRDKEGLLRSRKDKAVEIRFIERARNVRKSVEKLRKRQRGIEGLDLPEKEKELKIEQVDKMIRERMARFNRNYFDRKHSQTD